MNLFIFFALPLATIILAIVFQKILKSPILVAILFFAVYLIVSFTEFSDTLAEAIIATLIYTLIAYITAYIAMVICRCRRRVESNNTVYTRNDLNIESTCLENNRNTMPDIQKGIVHMEDTSINMLNRYENEGRSQNISPRKCYRR